MNIKSFFILLLLPLSAVSQIQSRKGPESILFDHIIRTKNTDSVLIYMNLFLKKYPAALSKWEYRPDAIYGAVAERMGEDKKWDQYEVYHAKLSKDEAVYLDDLMAGDLLHAGTDFLVAEKLALRSLQQINQQSSAQKYAASAFQYAELAYLNKHNSEGLPYADTAAKIIGGKESRAYGLYLKLLAKTADPSVALPLIEAHYRNGDVNDDEMPFIVEDLFAKVYKSGFDTYYTQLHNQLIEAIKTKVVKEKVSVIAPEFNLVNMKGEQVKLSDMKGKIVVIDFWATWCIYCKKGFPGMKKVMEKYKSNNQVVFLFINTQEELSEVLRKKQITAYLRANKYDFNTLLDTKKAKDFDVVTAYKVDGLPTKFVINKEGKISFKDIGYAGSDENLVNTLSAMIELAM